MGLLDELASYVGISKDALLTLFVGVVTVWIGYLLSERTQRRSSIFERKIDGYSQLASVCREIIRNHERLLSTNPNSLPGRIKYSYGITAEGWSKSIIVRSWKDVLKTPISKWIRFEKTKLIKSNAGSIGYRPLNFFYTTEYYESSSKPFPTPIFKLIHEQYENKIMAQGLEIYFSTRIRQKASQIYEMALSPEKYPKVTTRSYIQSVRELLKLIESEVNL